MSVGNKCHSVVNHAHIIQGQPQRKGICLAVVRQRPSLKYVKNVSYVDQLCSVKHVPNVQTVVKDLPVRARLNQFWETWEGRTNVDISYTLSLQTRPNLTRSLTISCYVHPHRKLYIASADKQKCSRVGQKSRIPGFLQLVIFGPKTKQQVETYTRSQQPQQIPQGQKIQNGRTGNSKDLSPDRGVGNVHRLQGRLLPHINSKPIQKVPQISCTVTHIPVQSTSIWSVHSTHGVHYSDQRGQNDGFADGYKDPPVPRRLVGPDHIPPNLSLAYTNTSSYLSGSRSASEYGEIRADPKQFFNFVGYQFNLKKRQGQTHPRPVADPHSKDPRVTGRTDLSIQAADVPHMVTDSHRETGSFWSTPYEAKTVAPEKWRVPEALEKVIPIPRSLHPHLKWWLEESKVLQSQPIHPLKYALQIFKEASKEEWGAHLNALQGETGPFQKTSYT